ncbi:MAG TPA: EAL domain-containing protein [Casimicrobiaceae bacterium]|nr:EAL domain-containing protein [Casimicrobiaceae bacterium]
MQRTRASVLEAKPTWWWRFYALHLHDYNRGATAMWVALALLGGTALALSCSATLARDTDLLWQIAGWIGIVAVAAWFPIQIPRSKHSIATGDLVIFLLLAQYGVAPAVLAASIEGLIGAVRSSKRLSSRIASASAAALGMTASGAIFGIAQSWLEPVVSHAAAHVAALSVAAMVHYVISTMMLMHIVYLKRGVRLTVGDWFGSTSWVATLYLVCAVFAGLLSLTGEEFGRSAPTVGILVIGLSLALLRVHFRRQIAEHEAQEARVTAAELEAAQTQKRFHAAFTQASIGMAIVSPAGRVVQFNTALQALLGYGDSRVRNRPFCELLHPSDASLLERRIADMTPPASETFSIELRCLAEGQREIWVSLHCAPFADDATGNGLIFQLHDITSRRRAEGALHHIAYHDSLTDLANRNCFQERLRVALERSREQPGSTFAVMYLDLDRFKTVNDSLGHPAGDELLKEVAARLRECVRPKDLVARLGGDEFAILVDGAPSRESVAALGDRLLDILRRPTRIAGTEIRPLASIGVTFSDLGYVEPETILRDADIAMYKAKAEGKGRIALFDAALHAELANRLELEGELRHAIASSELTLAFQPLYELEPPRLVGFEALARWPHPRRGAVSPGVFIPLAEETGSIEALTAWAIDDAVRVLASWRHAMPDAGDIVMHVNVSGKDLSRGTLVPHVREVLRRHRIPPHLLVLEITESTLMEQREKALHALGELRDLGVGLGIDDFGTGYSSLAYLSTLPFDCMKIDRSFVVGMQRSAQNVEIVRTVLSLGRALNKHVIAEGIETHDQLMRLIELGTPIGQGYLLGRPLDAAAAAQVVREHKLERVAA